MFIGRVNLLRIWLNKTEIMQKYQLVTI